MKRTKLTKLALATSAAALALGAAACEIENGELDPVEDPLLDDSFDEDL